MKPQNDQPFEVSPDKIPVMPAKFDALRIGRIEDGRRYLGNGCWERVNVEESRLNERREAWK